MAIYFSMSNELLLSTCREKRFCWYSTNPTNDDHQRRLGFYTMASQGVSIAMDDSKKRCFIGSTSGSIQFLKLNEHGRYELLTTLSGHTGKIVKNYFLSNR